MADKPPTCAQLGRQTELQGIQLKANEELAKATKTDLDAMRLEYGKEIAAIKVEVDHLKEAVRYWRNVAVGLGTATILLLLGILFKK